jgi:high-affinity K+ transport system ATPase subunit B
MNFTPRAGQTLRLVQQSLRSITEVAATGTGANDAPNFPEADLKARLALSGSISRIVITS